MYQQAAGAQAGGAEDTSGKGEKGGKGGGDDDVVDADFEEVK